MCVHPTTLCHLSEVHFFLFFFWSVLSLCCSTSALHCGMWLFSKCVMSRVSCPMACGVLVSQCQLTSHVQLFACPWTVATRFFCSWNSLGKDTGYCILDTRILVAIPFFRRSSRPRDQTWVSRIAGRFFTIWVTSDPYPGIKSASTASKGRQADS